MQREKGTLLYLLPSFVPNLTASPKTTSMGLGVLQGPKTSRSLSGQLLQDALVMLNGSSNLELLTFSSLYISDISELLSNEITSLRVMQMEPNHIAMPLFSVSVYYKFFPPNTFKGGVHKCTCELYVCQN